MLNDLLSASTAPDSMFEVLNEIHGFQLMFLFLFLLVFGVELFLVLFLVF